MAGIEGFELTIASDDTVIAMGTIDGVAIAAGTINGAGDADGTHLIVWTGSAFDHVASAAQVVTDIVLGTATVASDLVTVVSLVDRGRDPLAAPLA